MSYLIRSDWVQSMTKTTHDNGVTNCIGLVYVETKTELLGPI